MSALVDNIAPALILAAFVGVAALLVYDVRVNAPREKAEALQKAEVLVNDLPATVYRVYDRTTGRTFRAVRVNAEGGVVVLPDGAGPVEADK